MDFHTPLPLAFTVILISTPNRYPSGTMKGRIMANAQSGGKSALPTPGDIVTGALAHTGELGTVMDTGMSMAQVGWHNGRVSYWPLQDLRIVDLDSDLFMVQSMGTDGRWGTENTPALSYLEASGKAQELSVLPHVKAVQIITV